ncbi:MAG: glycosyltransferase [Calditrichaeota bacterium]|nr:MAG: glycosyltransferase [Calditrichota bacterium]
MKKTDVITRNGNHRTVDLSVVVPVMDEEQNVEILYERLRDVLDGTRLSFELIFVDDGSTDRTYDVLRTLHQQDPRLKVVKFRRNFGQSAAMAAGFEQARGRIVVSMDGDLQNDPGDIPAMVSKLEEGYDIVAGWRKNRKDKMLIRKVPSKIANRIIRFFTGVQLHDTGCSLKVYRAEIIRKIRLYGEMHRFIPALARIEGARIAEMVVNHHARQFGRSKYNLTRTFKVIMDLTTLNLFIKYLNKPLHFFGRLGLLFNLAGLGSIAGSAYLLASGSYGLSDLNVLVSLSFLMVVAGFQFIFFGLLANMVVSTGDRKNEQLREYFSVQTEN